MSIIAYKKLVIVTYLSYKKQTTWLLKGKSRKKISNTERQMGLNAMLGT